MLDTGLPAKPPVWASFSGGMDDVNVPKLMNALMVASGQYGHIHLQFQSHGGFIGDGIALYNFFRAFTTDLTLYNTGSVSSIAAIAYLGAKHRKVSQYATFMIHRSHRTMQGATAAQLEEAATSLRIDDRRTEAILRSHITLDGGDWKRLDYNDVIFSAEDSVTAGFADAITEFQPPPTESIKFV